MGKQNMARTHNRTVTEPLKGIGILTCTAARVGPGKVTPKIWAVGGLSHLQEGSQAQKGEHFVTLIEFILDQPGRLGVNSPLPWCIILFNWLDLVCWCFVEDFCFYVYKRYLSVLFLWYLCCWWGFFSLYQCNTGLIEWAGKSSRHFYFRRYFSRYDLCSFLSQLSFEAPRRQVSEINFSPSLFLSAPRTGWSSLSSSALLLPPAWTNATFTPPGGFFVSIIVLSSPALPCGSFQIMSISLLISSAQWYIVLICFGSLDLVRLWFFEHSYNS